MNFFLFKLLSTGLNHVKESKLRYRIIFLAIILSFIYFLLTYFYPPAQGHKLYKNKIIDAYTKEEVSNVKVIIILPNGVKKSLSPTDNEGIFFYEFLDTFTQSNTPCELHLSKDGYASVFYNQDLKSKTSSPLEIESLLHPNNFLVPSGKITTISEDGQVGLGNVEVLIYIEKDNNLPITTFTESDGSFSFDEGFKDNLQHVQGQQNVGRWVVFKKEGYTKDSIFLNIREPIHRPLLRKQKSSISKESSKIIIRSTSKLVDKESLEDDFQSRLPQLSQNIIINIIIDNDAIQGVEGGGDQNPYFYKTNLKIRINKDIIDLGVLRSEGFFSKRKDAKNDFIRRLSQKLESELGAIAKGLKK